MKEEESLVSELRRSSEQLGMLYPVLIDKNGNIIDGQHRLSSDPNWPKLKLNHVESERDLLLARIVSNVCRRTVSSQEKTQMLERLVEIYLNEGENPARIASRVVEETGMSYRWVMKYLPNRLKQRKHIHRTLRGQLPDKSKMNSEINRIARRAIAGIGIPASEPVERGVLVKNYANTSFVNLMMERRLFERLERTCRYLSLSVDALIYNVLLSAAKEIETLVNPVPLLNAHPRKE